MLYALVYVLLLASTTRHGASSPKHYLVEIIFNNQGGELKDYLVREQWDPVNEEWNQDEWNMI